jgi:hypothetical protein
MLAAISFDPDLLIAKPQPVSLCLLQRRLLGGNLPPASCMFAGIQFIIAAGLGTPYAGFHGTVRTAPPNLHRSTPPVPASLHKSASRADAEPSVLCWPECVHDIVCLHIRASDQVYGMDLNASRSNVSRIDFGLPGRIDDERFTYDPSCFVLTARLLAANFSRWPSSALQPARHHLLLPVASGVISWR